MLGGGTMLNCYGYPIPERQGNWQGHVFPGSIFLVWGVHWMLGTFWRFVAATRSGKAFHSRTTEGLLPFVPGIKAFNRKVPLESILKAVGGLLLFFLQARPPTAVHCKDVDACKTVWDRCLWQRAVHALTVQACIKPLPP